MTGKRAKIIAERREARHLEYRLKRMETILEGIAEHLDIDIAKEEANEPVKEEALEVSSDTDKSPDNAKNSESDELENDSNSEKEDSKQADVGSIDGSD